jgi:hypothetical protein
VHRLSGLDLLLVVTALVAVLAFFWRLPIERRHVRAGHPPTKWWRTIVMRRGKTFAGTREEFVAKYRRALTRNGWTGLIVGVGMLVITIVFVVLNANDGPSVVGLSVLVIFLSQGAGCFLSRRVLDSPPPGPATPPGGGQG